MKKFFIFFVFLLCSSFLIGENPQNSWKALEQATRALDEDDPASALRYAEIAKELRQKEYKEKISILESAIIPLPVQQVGDLIPDVLYVLESRNSYDAVNLINELLDKFGASYFSNSITNMLLYLEDYLEYPEADYLIGRVYMYEGEYDIAKEYYTRALSFSDILDVPYTQHDIKFDLAYLAKLQGDEKLYEESLLSILEQSTYFSPDGENYSYSLATINAAKQPRLADKYFLLYRIDSKIFIPAYVKIAEFYHENKAMDKAFFAITIGTLSSFTRINEILSMRNYEYQYTNLNDFFKLAITYPDINDWMLNNDIWNNFMLFADYVSNYDNKLLSNEIYYCIENYCPVVSLRNIAKKSY